MLNKPLILLLLPFVIFVLSCGDDPASPEQTPVTGCSFGSVTDIDGNAYKTIKIGDQWWMAENLRVTHYRNGDHIPHESDNAAWVGLDSGAYCKYDNADSNIAVFGLLYNWHAVDDTRDIAPSGWHVPTDDEWKELEMFLGMSQSDVNQDFWRGTDEGGKLKETGDYHTGTGLWQGPNIDATNETCFTALPGGIRNETTGEYTNKHYSAFFWSSSEYSGTIAWIRKLNNNSGGIGRYYGYKVNGISIRCIKD
jgi:uncharacterized protein (TIGR02145 family)